MRNLGIIAVLQWWHTRQYYVKFSYSLKKCYFLSREVAVCFVRFLFVHIVTYLLHAGLTKTCWHARRPIGRAAASTRVLVNFYFRLQISIFGCSFGIGSADWSQLMNCCNLWKLGASRFHLQLARLWQLCPQLRPLI